MGWNIDTQISYGKCGYWGIYYRSNLERTEKVNKSYEVIAYSYYDVFTWWDMNGVNQKKQFPEL